MSEFDCAGQVDQSIEFVRRHCSIQPRAAIVLGSGLGGLATEIEHSVSIPYADIPFFPTVSAVGHAGNLILGQLAGVNVVAMQGRVHRYEGYSNDQVAFPATCMLQLGARTLIVTNAAGGLNPRFRRCDVMAIDQHMHWLWNQQNQLRDVECNVGVRSSKSCVTSQPDVRVARSNSPYTENLIQAATESALRSGRILHRGTYLSTLGPTYETRAEYRMFRAMGADAVGMSTTPEVLAATRLRVSVLGLSVITNVASTDLPQSTTHEEVVDSSLQAEPLLKSIIGDVVRDLVQA